MAPLHIEDLDLSEIRVAVDAFRNLFYHRTVLVEGIRRIAMRNMLHLTDAKQHCNAHASSPEEDDWVPRVQAKMLSDQDLEDNEVNRMVVAWATFYPVQVYLALLYAEIEYARNMQSESRFFEDDQLFPYLDRREEAITKLHGFRNSFLHPNSESSRCEIVFLAHGNSYNAAPEMQAALDGYLQRVNQKLIAPLDDSDVLPLATELSSETPSRRQPPMNLLLLQPLFSDSGGQERYGDSRVAKHAIRNTEFIRRLLIAAGVMTNEVLQELLNKGPEAALAELQDERLHHAELIAAPARLSAALLYEPLRLYSEMEKQDASVHDETLSGLVVNLKEPLCEFRNAVFHVPDYTKDPAHLDHAAVGTLHDTIGHFYVGLAKFFGPRLPS